MARRSVDEQIAATEKKLAVEKNRLRELKAKKRVADRKQKEKDRVHRLIQIGAICEEVYGGAITEGLMQDALRQFLRDQDTRGNFYSSKLNAVKGSSAPEVSADGAAENNQ